MTRRWSLLGWFAALCGVRAAAQQIGTKGGDTGVWPANSGIQLRFQEAIKIENGQCPRCGWRASKLTKAFMDKRIERMALLMSQPEHPGALEYYYGSKPKVLMECADCCNAFVQYAE